MLHGIQYCLVSWQQVVGMGESVFGIKGQGSMFDFNELSDILVDCMVSEHIKVIASHVKMNAEGVNAFLTCQICCLRVRFG